MAIGPFHIPPTVELRMSSVPVPDMVEPPVNVIAVPFLSKDPIRPPFSTVTVFPLTVIPVEP